MTFPGLAMMVFSLGAAGEIAIGAIVVVFPQLVAALIDAPLDGPALLVSRMLGSALLALGLTWWSARRDAQGPARCMAGFMVYNVAVGGLFTLRALQAAQPLLPWLVGIAHLVLAGALLTSRALARQFPAEADHPAR